MVRAGSWARHGTLRGRGAEEDAVEVAGDRVGVRTEAWRESALRGTATPEGRKGENGTCALRWVVLASLPIHRTKVCQFTE